MTMNLALRVWSVFKVRITPRFAPVFVMMANAPVVGCASRSILLKVKLTFVYLQRLLEMEFLVTLARMVKSVQAVFAYQMVRAPSALNHAHKTQIVRATPRVRD